MTLNPRNAEMASIRLYEAETSVETIAARHGLDPASIVDFSLNVNPFGPPRSAISAAAEALATAHLYPDLRFARLRQAVAGRHGVEQDSLFFGAGLDDVIKLLTQAWTNQGDRVLVHLPTFPRYELEARLWGCEIVAVESTEPWTVDLGRIAKAMAAVPIALAYLCTPNNPTGATIDGTGIEGLAKSFPETILLVDEALIDPDEDGLVPLTRRYRNVAVMRTFSKYLGLAGLRVGYAVAHPDLIGVAEVGRPPFNVASPSVPAACAALADAEFRAACRGAFKQAVARFAAELREIGGVTIRGANANMLLLELHQVSAPEAADALAREGVLVADATSFRGLESHRVLRVSLRDEADNTRLLGALRRVLQ